MPVSFLVVVSLFSLLMNNDLGYASVVEELKQVERESLQQNYQGSVSSFIIKQSELRKSDLWGTLLPRVDYSHSLSRSEQNWGLLQADKIISNRSLSLTQNIPFPWVFTEKTNKLILIFRKTYWKNNSNNINILL